MLYPNILQNQHQALRVMHKAKASKFELKNIVLKSPSQPSLPFDISNMPYFFLRKPKNSSFFSGPTTKALIFFLELQKQFFFLSDTALTPLPFFFAASL